MRFRHKDYTVDRYGYLREEATDELYRKTLKAHAELVNELLSEAKAKKREQERERQRREYWNVFTNAQLFELFEEAKARGDFHNATEFAREMAYRRENA